MTLTILKFIYGDLNPEKIERLKKTFKQEVRLKIECKPNVVFAPEGEGVSGYLD